MNFLHLSSHLASYPTTVYLYVHVDTLHTTTKGLQLVFTVSKGEALSTVGSVSTSESVCYQSQCLVFNSFTTGGTATV